jgi:GLPGLI family protein
LIECIYSYRVYDPERKDNRELFNILEIGRNYSKYSNYASYQVDSIITYNYPTGITNNEYDYLFKKHHPTSEAIVKDFKTNTLSNYDKVFLDYYVYTESIPAMKWELSNETSDVCGQRCRKATTTFRGRNWTAWYCNLPQSNGPWKFGNLPGLILKVEDDKHEHVFEAVTIRKGNGNFGLKNYGYQKTSRDKFKKTQAEYKSNPMSFLVGSTISASEQQSTRNTKLFYNPIEKD